MADGGEVIGHHGSQNVQERAITANEIACQLVAIDGVQDFAPFCAVVEDVQRSILTEWSHEERRQQRAAQPARVVAE